MFQVLPSLAQATEPACSRENQGFVKTKNYGDSGRTKLMESSVRELRRKAEFSRKQIVEV